MVTDAFQEEFDINYHLPKLGNMKEELHINLNILLCLLYSKELIHITSFESISERLTSKSLHELSVKSVRIISHSGFSFSTQI